MNKIVVRNTEMTYPIPFDQYQQALGEGRFLGLRCSACGAVIFPPAAVCRECAGSDLAPAELGGRGTLRTFTVIRVAPEGRKPPYIVAMAELDEGPWAIGNLVGIDPNRVDMGIIGRRVRLGSHLVTGDAPPSQETRVLTFTIEET